MPRRSRPGNLIAQRIERSGNVNNSADPRGVTSVGVVPGVTTNHSIASVFYEFLQRTGPVYENGQNRTAAIFVPDVLRHRDADHRGRTGRRSRRPASSATC